MDTEFFLKVLVWTVAVVIGFAIWGFLDLVMQDVVRWWYAKRKAKKEKQK